MNLEEVRDDFARAVEEAGGTYGWAAGRFDAALAQAWEQGIDDYLKFKSFGHDIGRPTNPWRTT